ncbi:hypothetical protein RFI_29420 [Reticulomyxa filosa]|uniref:Uncharacterized protein n=1 Tax=Reticulomyxa filosa TaxID=46433 RepID=X6M4K6_RETFI|nr:hypothetical protein RFI_29420 [Reticulomyxa filosa]|eukprot:ETO07970.1 hypothetical protein RFI_29420 [Reticulomyxa filosa]
MKQLQSTFMANVNMLKESFRTKVTSKYVIAVHKTANNLEKGFHESGIMCTKTQVSTVKKSKKSFFKQDKKKEIARLTFKLDLLEEIPDPLPPQLEEEVNEAKTDKEKEEEGEGENKEGEGGEKKKVEEDDSKDLELDENEVSADEQEIAKFSDDEAEDSDSLAEEGYE